MNLAEYIEARRNGAYVPTCPQPSVFVPAGNGCAFVAVIPPEREPMRLPPCDTAARCFRKYYESSGRRGRKPRYKNLRRGGLHFRKHLR